jgi:glycosyltransferase 2 family protein
VTAARTWIWLAVGALIGVAVLSAFGDLRDLGDRLGEFAWSGFVACLALALGNYTIRFLRWQLYLDRADIRIPIGASAIVFGSGLSLAITPAKLGELVKSYLLRELHDVPIIRSAPIVVAERVTDLLALLLVAVLGVAAYGVETTVVIVSALLIGVLLVVLAWPALARTLVTLVTKPRLLARLRAPLLDTYANLAALCRPRVLVAATLLAVPAWFCECVGFSIVIDSFVGAHCALGLAIVIYAATTIAGALSFLPGGLGVTEGAMTLLLVRTAAHLDEATATAATLVTRLATLWFAVVLGLAFLAVARRRVRARMA